MFTSILTDVSQGLTIWQGGLCTLAALGLGLLIALVYRLQSAGSRSFMMTLAILPALVQFVIMMVNGNLGTGVAVLGAFSLVRFRSVPGSSKEIIFIFFSMSIGLAIGMGYLSFAIFMSIVVSCFSILLSKIAFLQPSARLKELKIVLPEDLDYTDIFTDILNQYTRKYELLRVKTIQLGSMIEILYEVDLKSSTIEKQMIDEIRVRNGNLSVICAKRQVNLDEL